MKGGGKDRVGKHTVKERKREREKESERERK